MRHFILYTVGATGAAMIAAGCSLGLIPLLIVGFSLKKGEHL